MVRARREHARAVSETLQLLQDDGRRALIREAVASVPASAQREGGFDRTSAQDAEPDPGGAPAPASAAPPAPREEGPTGAVLAQDDRAGMQVTPEGAIERPGFAEPPPGRGAEARPPIGRYLDGLPGADDASGVRRTGEVRRDTGAAESDPLKALHIKAEVAAAQAPFRVLQIREQQYGLAALLAAKDHPATWAQPGHVFPNGWTLVDVTADSVAFLAPGGRVLRVRLPHSGRPPWQAGGAR